MKTKGNNTKNVRINVRLTREDRKKYKDHCDLEYKTSISNRIRDLIKLDIEGKLQQPK